MASSIFLYLDGIPGESTAEDFENWIDVSSFSVATTMEIEEDERVSGGGGVSGAASGEDFSITTKMSTATPVLLYCCAVGAIIPRGKIVQNNVAQGKVLPVSCYALGDSIISNVTVDASGGEIPDTSVSINYGSIIWQYYCYNHRDPSDELGKVQREWNLLASTRDASSRASAAFAIKRGRYSKHGPKVDFDDEKPITQP